MLGAFRMFLLALIIAAALAAPAGAFIPDARGDVTSNGLIGFTYDFANQPLGRDVVAPESLRFEQTPRARRAELARAVGGAIPATHEYDPGSSPGQAGNFKRVKTVENGKTVYQLFSRVTGGLVYRDEMTDGETTDYVSVGAAALRLKKTTTLTPEYVHFDHQGSAVAATNAAGAVLWRERYSPWGTRLLKPAGNKGDTGFTGHLIDNTTELVYMQARYYDSQIGRFYSTDPVGYQDQLNLYAYVANDPVNKTDPTGEEIGDRFDTPDAAAEDAVASVNPQSIEENVEYGGTVQREATVVGTNRDGSPDVKLQYYASEPDKGDFESSSPAGYDRDTTVGEYHTHGDYSKYGADGGVERATQAENPSADRPSVDDRQGAADRRSDTAAARSAYGEPYVAKLGTPSGEIKDY